MKVLLLIPVILFGLTGACRSENLKKEDFAYGYHLAVEQNTPFHILPVPMDVYLYSVYKDRRDIKVFDREGKYVPYQLRKPETKRATPGDPVSVPFFPLYTASERREDGAEDLAMLVKRDDQGMVVDVRVQGNGGDKVKLTGYLLDLHHLDPVPSQLELYWRESDKRMVNLRLETSSDLTNWKAMLGRVTVASLEHGEHKVVQREVRLSDRVLPYLRISWPETAQPLELMKITGFAREDQARKRLYHNLESEESPEERRTGKDNLGHYVALAYTMPLHVEISEAQLRLPRSNSYVYAALFSRSDSGEEWRQRCRRNFFRLEVGPEELINNPCATAASFDRFWELRVYDDGAGVGDGEKPKLELGWLREELLFANQGKPPFMVAFGNGALQDRPPGSSIVPFSSILSGEQNGNLVSPARIKGDLVELAGEAALTVPKNIPWKKWMLWTILIGGITLLAAMARIVYRELGRQQGRS